MSLRYEASKSLTNAAGAGAGAGAAGASAIEVVSDRAGLEAGGTKEGKGAKEEDPFPSLPTCTTASEEEQERMKSILERRNLLGLQKLQTDTSSPSPPSSRPTTPRFPFHESSGNTPKENNQEQQELKQQQPCAPPTPESSPPRRLPSPSGAVVGTPSPSPSPRSYKSTTATTRLSEAAESLACAEALVGENVFTLLTPLHSGGSHSFHTADDEQDREEEEEEEEEKDLLEAGNFTAPVNDASNTDMSGHVYTNEAMRQLLRQKQEQTPQQQQQQPSASASASQTQTQTHASQPSPEHPTSQYIEDEHGRIRHRIWNATKRWFQQRREQQQREDLIRQVYEQRQKLLMEARLAAYNEHQDLLARSKHKHKKDQCRRGSKSSDNDTTAICENENDEIHSGGAEQQQRQRQQGAPVVSRGLESNPIFRNITGLKTFARKRMDRNESQGSSSHTPDYEEEEEDEDYSTSNDDGDEDYDSDSYFSDEYDDDDDDEYSYDSEEEEFDDDDDDVDDDESYDSTGSNNNNNDDNDDGVNVNAGKKKDSIETNIENGPDTIGTTTMNDNSHPSHRRRQYRKSPRNRTTTTTTITNDDDNNNNGNKKKKKKGKSPRHGKKSPRTRKSPSSSASHHHTHNHHHHRRHFRRPYIKVYEPTPTPSGDGMSVNLDVRTRRPDYHLDTEYGGKEELMPEVRIEPDPSFSSNKAAAADYDDDDDKEHVPYILNRKQMKLIVARGLPASLMYCKWKRLYSLVRDGDSFDAFLRMVKGEGRTVLVIKTTRGAVFGGYADSAWEPQHNSLGGRFYGSGQACLFRVNGVEGDDDDDEVDGDKEDMKNAKEDMDGSRGIDMDTAHNRSEQQQHKSKKREKKGGNVTVYKWTGMNRYIQLCDVSNKMIAFGGGGKDGSFGLCVENDFQRGSTGTCDTFNNDPLCDQENFDIMDVELWGFVTGSF